MDPTPQFDYFSMFLASAQSSFEVLFVCMVGYLAANYGIITENSQKNLSQLIIKVLMPCLLFSEIGPVINISKLISLWPIPVFTLVFTSIGAALGLFGGKMVLSLKIPETKFLMTGIMFNNLISLLMGLLRGMENSSVMELLMRDKDDTPKATVKRGKQYILLVVLFSTLLRWSIGANLLKKEIDTRVEVNDEQRRTTYSTYSTIVEPTMANRECRNNCPNETTRLLIVIQNDENDGKKSNVNNRDERRDNLIIKTFKAINEVMNPPLYAAMLALFVGSIRPLRSAFFDDNAPFTVITQSVDYVGTITVPLTLMGLGAQLKNLPRSKGQSMIPTIGYTLICRYFVMPLVSIILVLLTKDWFVRDPMLWFILMLSAGGPTAVNCLNLAQLNNSFQEEMAALLFYSYIAMAPLVTLIVTGTLTIIGWTVGYNQAL